MPLNCIVATGSADNPPLLHEQRGTRMAQIYREMSDGEYLQHRDDYYAFHPLAKSRSWRQYLEDLADDEHEEMRQAETAARSRYCHTYSAFGPHRAYHGGSYTCESLNYGDDSSHGHSGERIVDRPHCEEHMAGQFGKTNIGGLGTSWSREYRIWSEPEMGLNGISNNNSHTMSEQEEVRRERRPSLQSNPLDGIGGGESEPRGREDRNNTAITGLRDSRRPDLPPTGYSDININSSGPRHVPQPPLQPDHGHGRGSGGRYNAGVRALRSPETPRRSILANGKQAHPSKGRYNMGVRLPRSQAEPSPQDHAGIYRALSRLIRPFLGSKRKASH